MTSIQRLAIDGGTPAFPEGPPRWPPADEAVTAALAAAAADGSWGRYDGPHTAALTDHLRGLLDVEHVLPCCSGTFAVQLALRAVGIAAGDEVVLAGYDYPGNFRSIEAIGAVPVLVDVSPAMWLLDLEQLAQASGSKIRAVIVSHLHGGLVPMRRVVEMAHERGWSVVEDACQAPGAIVEGRPAGSWGDAGTFSFGGSKLLTAGRGGALVTRDPNVAQRAKIFCHQGNHAYPLSELQAAVLVPQLDQLAERNRERAANAAWLAERLKNLPGLRPLVDLPADSSPAYYKFGFEYRPRELGGCSRERFIEVVQAEGIALDIGFRGFVHRGPGRCRRVGELHHSQEGAERLLVLHHPIVLEGRRQMDRLASALEKVCKSLSGSA
jgi:dTDP-4-amino-4,6-dideoxygalactose transaminase